LIFKRKVGEIVVVVNSRVRLGVWLNKERMTQKVTVFKRYSTDYFTLDAAGFHQALIGTTVLLLLKLLSINKHYENRLIAAELSYWKF
jgi:hypothetical protein